MSYARIGAESDVYVYVSSAGIECCMCRFLPAWGTELCPTNAAMLDHLDRHIAAGHRVPPSALARLRDPEDVAENEAIWAER